MLQLVLPGHVARRVARPCGTKYSHCNFVFGHPGALPRSAQRSAQRSARISRRTTSRTCSCAPSTCPRWLRHRRQRHYTRHQSHGVLSTQIALSTQIVLPGLPHRRVPLHDLPPTWAEHDARPPSMLNLVSYVYARRHDRIASAPTRHPPRHGRTDNHASLHHTHFHAMHPKPQTHPARSCPRRRRVAARRTPPRS